MPVSTECAAALLSFRYPSLRFILTIYDMEIPGVTRNYMWLQGVTMGYRGLQGVTTGDRALQGVTREYRGVQRIIETFSN